MDLTKELLAGASFRAKGKWYAAQQVDAFLEELSVRLEEDSREREELAEDARALRRENARLREELAAAKAAPPVEALPPEDPRLPVCRDLERERDSLLQDIKALRRFRESFRQAVEEAYDAQTISLPPLEEITVNLYPDSGQQRVAEILLTWGEGTTSVPQNFLGTLENSP